MDPALAALLANLAFRLAPVIEDAVVFGVKALVALIPNADRDWAWGCLDITRGIYQAHPDWSEEQKRRYATDAIIVLARDMGVPLDPASLTIQPA